jgi:hypothetical protein
MRIERGGWMAHHPASGKLTHVVTKAWFDEVKLRAEVAEMDLSDAQQEIEQLRRLLETAPPHGDLLWHEKVREALEGMEVG